MKIGNYEIIIKEIELPKANKFDIGDIVKITNHRRKIGIVSEIRDDRQNRNYIKEGQIYHYVVEVSDGAFEVNESDLKLIISFSKLLKKTKL